MTAAITVENLSKAYLIRHRKMEPYTALRDVLAGNAKALGRKLLRPLSGDGFVIQEDLTKEEYWALRDINLEVKEGDRVGIIGRNGAGKSTLLKILSRVTEPTSGRICITGRVVSLLEVGTGFHPELTGRENIYLNGAILGMSREEIRRRFDEIIDFAEVEKFLDTPVKRYSSGMYVRLAFAIAAHLESEILIVDEVLAVGDAQFQDKCLGKMREAASSGRTLLFVSHNMSAINALCGRCLILDGGKIQTYEKTSTAINAYLRRYSERDVFVRPPTQSDLPTITTARINRESNSDSSDPEICLEIHCRHSHRVSLDVRIKDGLGNPVGFGSLGALNPMQLLDLRPGFNLITLTLQTHHLALGTYYLSFDITVPTKEYFDRVDNCLVIELARSPSNGANRVLLQSWGYGSCEIPVRLKGLVALKGSDDHA